MVFFQRAKTDEHLSAMASLVAEIKAELNTLKSSANSYQTSVEQLKSQSAQQNTEISTIRASSKNFIDRTTCKAAVEFSAALKVIKRFLYNSLFSSSFLVNTLTSLSPKKFKI